MLDDLAVLIEAENIDARPVLITVRGPFLVAMENDTVSFRDGTLEVHAFAWVFRSHALEVFDEGLFSVRDVRIVLNVSVTDIALNCFGWLTLIKHEVIERHGVLPVSLESINHVESSKPLSVQATIAQNL